MSFSFTGAFAPDLQIAGFSRNECRTLYELLWLKASPEVTRKGLEVLGGGAGALVPEPGMGEPMDKALVWALVHGDLTIGAFCSPSVHSSAIQAACAVAFVPETFMILLFLSVSRLKVFSLFPLKY